MRHTHWFYFLFIALLFFSIRTSFAQSSNTSHAVNPSDTTKRDSIHAIQQIPSYRKIAEVPLFVHGLYQGQGLYKDGSFITGRSPDFGDLVKVELPSGNKTTLAKANHPEEYSWSSVEEIQPYLSLIKDILIIIGVILGGFLSVKLYLRFAPDIIFRITPIWSEVTRDMVVLKIEIENKSKVKLTKEKIKFKIIRHSKSDLSELSEWIDIDEQTDEICKSTQIFYPGSILRIDKLYHCKDDEILQGIIRFEARFSKLGKILADIKGEKETWTNTFIIIK